MSRANGFDWRRHAVRSTAGRCRPATRNNYAQPLACSLYTLLTRPLCSQSLKRGPRDAQFATPATVQIPEKAPAHW
ncbi:hypothetical protein PQR01_08545 [Paraburkholderia rhynchosiae]|uniref:Uncharacterized protein n=1 Tax=Paraburkholderia rhynchosiae TaxID=487049 RepID=A0ACC7N9U7_9BURK